MITTVQWLDVDRTMVRVLSDDYPERGCEHPGPSRLSREVDEWVAGGGVILDPEEDAP